MPGKQYSVIIAPSDGSKSYHLQVSLRAVLIVGVALLLLGSAVAFLTATYASLAWKVRDYDDLAERCAGLEVEAGQVEGLRAELAELRDMDLRVRRLVGLPERPQGGALTGESLEGGDSTPPGTVAVTLSEALVADSAQAAQLERDLRARSHALPWPVEGFVTSSFGEGRAAGIHPGIDIAAPRNTVIETPLAGTVVGAGWNEIYGYMAVIDHGGGLVTVYGHNERLVVRQGDRVRAGDAVAFLGNTGKSSAPHLHFEVRKDGYAIDPTYLLNRKRTPDRLLGLTRPAGGIGDEDHDGRRSDHVRKRPESHR